MSKARKTTPSRDAGRYMRSSTTPACASSELSRELRTEALRARSCPHDRSGAAPGPEQMPRRGGRLEPIKRRLTDTLREMREDLQSSISYAGGRVLTDLKKVNYVVLGGENAGEHLFM